MEWTVVAVKVRRAVNEYDTIVVGLGAAGTVAASMLARAGRRVLALEAQNRIGGRVHTVPFGEGIAELGAEWIHGTENSIVYNTAIDNNIIVYNTGIDNNITILPQDVDSLNVLQSDGEVMDKNITDIIYNVVQYVNKTAKPQSAADVITRRLADFINEHSLDILGETTTTEILRFIQIFIERILAASSWEDLNAQELNDILGDHKYMSWCRKGYKTFFELLLDTYGRRPGLPNLDIKLNTEVTKIKWPQEADGVVTVTTNDGSIYKAENVIVTVSVGVLKERHQDMFSPSLPQQKVTSIEKIQIGVIGKIIFAFDDQWWPSEGFYHGFMWKEEDLDLIPDEWTTFIQGAYTPLGAPNTVTLWTVGDITKQVEVMPENEIKEKALSTLSRFMRTEVTEPSAMLRTTWFSNKFTRGAYTYKSLVEAEFPTARADLEAPLMDKAGKLRVLFAGEGSHASQYATVHGAADTGRREAMRLLDTKMIDFLDDE
ncbi:flavin containing amine oxidoreductase domain-containing protein [Phthorimaea operculella]|nr:flavin containing amine oxidoreductase domain-containing protein [Phthorimaea operculella]